MGLSSVVLSFVGNQDPVSDGTREDGSIVSLVRHLLDMQQPIKRVWLLYTVGTQERAQLTQGWLMDAPFRLPPEAIALLPVDPALSEDPVNLWLAVQAARQGLEAAIAHASPTDLLEFNASSGTPVMKSAWSLLQAAGYAPRSRVWQIRNPREQQAGQARVFQTNIQVLRREFDIKVIRQQLEDYNYHGALTSLRAAGLATPEQEALLEYGHCRLSLDFQRAKEAIAPVRQSLDAQWWQDIQALVQRDRLTLIREAYFNAVVELKNRQLSDVLVRVSQFQEQVLQYLARQQLAGRPALPETFEETEAFWQTLAQQRPELWDFLQRYQYRGFGLRLEGFPSRPVLQAIVDNGQHPSIEALQVLNEICRQRNRYIHNFEGISELPEAQTLLKTMRQILTELGQSEFANPFNALNQAVLRGLEEGKGEGMGLRLC